MIFHYCRVSSKDQNLDRQLEALNSYKPADKVFCDKQSGKNFNRSNYQILKTEVRPGDEVIIKELDRLGRNKDEIKAELQWFKVNEISVRILDIPTTLIDLGGQKWVSEMVNNVLIEVMGAIAEQERIKIRSRQNEGIAAMPVVNGKKISRKTGNGFGRPKMSVPNFAPIYKKTVDGEMSVVQAIRELGITKAKWYRLCKEVV